MKDFYIKPYQNPTRPGLKYRGFFPRDPISKKRKSQFFETKVEAQTWLRVRIAKRNRHGTEADISTELAVIALQGQRELAVYGEGLSEAIAYRLAFLRQRARSCEIGRLFAEVVEEKSLTGCSSIHVSQMKLVGKRAAEFAEKRGLKLASDFAAAHIKEFLAELPGESAHTWNNNRMMLATVFGYGKKHDYVSENVVEKVDPKKTKQKAVEYHQSGEAAKLLAAAEPKILPGVAIQLFAGFREEEVCRLDWSEVHLWDKPKQDKFGNYCGIINLPGEKAKKGRRRPVKIRANLAAWLWPFTKTKGRVVIDYNRGVAKACKRAGILRKRNGLRHSYGTFHFAYFDDSTVLMEDMGHTSLATAKKHYLNLGVSDEDAAAYWQIAPSSRPETSNIFAFKPESHWWFHKVESILQGTWIQGPENLARFFGVGHGAPYHWFKMPGVPPRPEDDRFHEPTWRAWVEEKLPQRRVAKLLYYVVWRSSAKVATREERQYFASELEAKEFADDRNRKLLAEEIHLEAITDVLRAAATRNVIQVKEPVEDQLISF